MPKRGPDGKFLPENKDAETQAPVIDVDERIAELETQLAEKDEKIAELQPTRDVAHFNFQTREDVVAFFGEQALDQKVQHQIALENKKRTREGFDRIKYDAEEFAAKRDEFIDSLLADKATVQPPVEGWLSRGLKMLRPDDTLVQIPYEVQVNNVAGSLADGYVRYERKGFKRTSPMLCPSMDCWNVAAEENGKWVHKGYCSEDHLTRTERGAEIPA